MRHLLKEIIPRRMKSRTKTLFLACAFFSFLLSFKFMFIKKVVRYSGVSTTQRILPVRYSSTAGKHITKSLSELGRMDEINRNIIFLNLIPKSGAEVLLLLLKRLEGWNNFRHVRLKSRGTKLSQAKQEKFVRETYNIIRKEAVPLVFDKEMYFVNFTKFGRQSPNFINLIRDPADYIFSRFYYSQYNITKIWEDEKLIDTGNNWWQISPHSLSDLSSFLFIPYFCGQNNKCTSLNNKWALDRAKINVDKYYSVVGVLEHIIPTLEIFEKRISYFFKGVKTKFKEELSDFFKNHFRQSQKAPSGFRNYIKENLITEYEFYEWIKSRLFKKKQNI